MDYRWDERGSRETYQKAINPVGWQQEQRDVGKLKTYSGAGLMGLTEG